MNQKPHESDHQDVDDARLTAYALGQLDAADSAEVERWLSEVGASRAAQALETIEQIRTLSDELVEAARHDPRPAPSPRLRTAIEHRLAEIETTSPLPQAGEGQGVRAANSAVSSSSEASSTTAPKPRSNPRRWLALAAAACLLAVVVPAALWTAFFSPQAAPRPLAYEWADSGPRTPAMPGATVPATSAELSAEASVDPLVASEGHAAGKYGYFNDKDGLEKNLSRLGVAANSSPQGPESAAARGLSVDRAGGSGQPLPGWSEGAKLGDAIADKEPASGSLTGLPSTAPTATSSERLGGRSSRGKEKEAAPRGEPVVTFGSEMGGTAAMPATPALQSGLQDIAQKGVRPAEPARPAMGQQPGETVLSTRVYAVDELVVPLKASPQPVGGTGGMGGMGGDSDQAATGPGAAEPRQPLLKGGGDMYNRLAGPQAGAGVALSDLNGPTPEQSPPGKPAPNALATGAQLGQQPFWDQLGSSRFSTDGRDPALERGGAQEQLGRGLDRSAPGTEQYEPIVENDFLSAAAEPLSTFSIDVDTASYANVRRFLVSGRLPPPAAVRIEELVNYFPYDYPEPDGEHPFSVNMEAAQCPWNGDHRLVRIGLKGREIHRKERPPSNLVFLLDVSGSMSDQNKLPLVKEGMRMLVDQLGEDDRVAIVTYAGNAGLALDSTNGENKQQILQAIESLRAGGSTHGSAGIQMAYGQAAEHFVENGTNRVLLATDGDLNVGVTGDDQLVELIREKAKTGVFLTVLGFGTGNLKDAKLEKLADNGNGSYAYIDSLREAYKVLVQQATGSLVTIAKDVKIQVEFNPAQARSYRLIGYENRMLAAEDFADDTKDAGEIGAGHTVTALYEIVPAGPQPAALAADREGGAAERTDARLKYQRPTTPELTEEARSGELLTLQLRYKQPQAQTSELVEYALKDAGRRFGEASDDFRFAAAVASFGLVLRGSQYAAGLGLSAVEEFAAGALGRDAEGYRREFTDLVRQTEATFAAADVARSAAEAARQMISAEPSQPAQASQAEPADRP